MAKLEFRVGDRDEEGELAAGDLEVVDEVVESFFESR
jgi:hypothetical protein